MTQEEARYKMALEAIAGMYISYGSERQFANAMVDIAKSALKNEASE